MASAKTLNKANLEALGASRLADLLLEISEGNAPAKRRLRLELAGSESPAQAARQIRSRLATIARSRGVLEGPARRALIDDLEAQRRAIVEQVGRTAPNEALELMWRFLDLSDPVYRRCDDSHGTIGGIFHTAMADLGALARSAQTASHALADQVFDALGRNDYGVFDGLVPTLAPVLGSAGQDHLKQRLTRLLQQQMASLAPDDYAARARASATSRALRAIADAQGDVDAFIEQYNEVTRTMPQVAVEIATRQLAAGRAEAAWQTIEATDRRRSSLLDTAWENVRIATLDALGRGEDAQQARWSCFARHLSAQHLRDYLKHLPDFDDFEAEQRGLDHAEHFADPLQALSFLIDWPALDRAARLVLQRAAKIDGNHYEIIGPAVEALAGKHKLAATLLLRAMIDFTLAKARFSRYGHAARHLKDCAGLAPAIADFGGAETHDAYVSRLRREHARKPGFWSLVG